MFFPRKLWNGEERRSARLRLSPSHGGVTASVVGLVSHVCTMSSNKAQFQMRKCNTTLTKICVKNLFFKTVQAVAWYKTTEPGNFYRSQERVPAQFPCRLFDKRTGSSTHDSVLGFKPQTSFMDVTEAFQKYTCSEALGHITRERTLVQMIQNILK